MRKKVILASEDESSGFSDEEDVCSVRSEDTSHDDDGRDRLRHDQNSAMEEVAGTNMSANPTAMIEPADRPIGEASVDESAEDLSIDELMEASLSRRSHTTMERLQSNVYQSRGTYGKMTSTRGDAVSDSLHIQQETRDLSGASQDFPHSGGQSQNKHTQPYTSMIDESIPSSRELFAVGSTSLPKEFLPDQSFQTQTTLPFTLPDQGRLSPMVLIPTEQVPSSDVLAGHIDEISDYLQQDIANASMLLQTVSTDLPSTDYDRNVSSILAETAIDSRSLADPNAAKLKTELSLESKESDLLSENSDIKAKPEAAIEDQHGMDRRNDDDSQDIAAYSDASDIGAPKELYHPRASRSRTKRSAPDADAQPDEGRKEPTGKSERKSERKTKRRKTVGDSFEEPLSVDEDSPTPSKSSGRGRKPKNATSQTPAQNTSTDIRDSDQAAGDEQEPEMSLVAAAPTLPAAVKKKRGRPRKTDQSSKGKNESVATDSKLEVNDPKAEHTDADRTAEARVDSKVGTGRMARRTKSSVVLSDSEDELAGPSDIVPEEDADDSQPQQTRDAASDKQGPTSAKRGKKKKRAAGRPSGQEESEQFQEEVEPEADAVDDENSSGLSSRLASRNEHDPPDVQPREGDHAIPSVPEANTEVATGAEVASPSAKTPRTPKEQMGNLIHMSGPIPIGKVPYRVGLSRRSRIAPLLKMVRKK